MLIRQLQESDDRRRFDCGSEPLNIFIQRYAGQNQRIRASATLVALDVDDKTVIGFVTVCAGAIRAEVLPASEAKGFSRHPQPTVVVARIAVDVRFQGRGIGATLLVRAYQRALAQADLTGCIGIEVDAKPGRESFYEDQGFLRLDRVDEGEQSRFFLPISAIEDAVQNS